MFAAGTIAAAIYNVKRRSKDDPVLSAADFVPELISAEAPGEPEEDEIDIEAQRAELRAFFGIEPKN